MIKELKARAYDIMATIERLQIELRNTNQLIYQELQKEVKNGNNQDTNREREKGIQADSGTEQEKNS